MSEDKVVLEIPIKEARELLKKYPNSCYLGKAVKKWNENNLDPTEEWLRNLRPGDAFTWPYDGVTPKGSATRNNLFVKLTENAFQIIPNCSGKPENYSFSEMSERYGGNRTTNYFANYVII